MSYIKRNLENLVSQVTKEYPVVLVTGPRQVGKTTMLQKLMEGTDRGYVTLDDLSERALAKSDPELFLQLHKPPVLIDEVQYAPELFTYIKMNVDKNQLLYEILLSEVSCSSCISDDLRYSLTKKYNFQNIQ